MLKRIIINNKTGNEIRRIINLKFCNLKCLVFYLIKEYQERIELNDIVRKLA